MQRMYVDQCLPEMDFLNKVFKHGATCRLHLFKSSLGISSRQNLHPVTLVDLLLLVERIKIFAKGNKLEVQKRV